jgi:flagellar assembly factor FliW
MTFAINIETKYRIPVIFNNKKKLFQGTIKKNSYKEHYKQYRSQGSVQEYHL